MAKALWDSVAAIWSKKTRECCKRGWDPIFMERRPRTGSEWHGDNGKDLGRTSYKMVMAGGLLRHKSLR